MYEMLLFYILNSDIWNLGGFHFTASVGSCSRCLFSLCISWLLSKHHVPWNLWTSVGILWGLESSLHPSICFCPSLRDSSNPRPVAFQCAVGHLVPRLKQEVFILALPVQWLDFLFALMVSQLHMWLPPRHLTSRGPQAESRPPHIPWGNQNNSLQSTGFSRNHHRKTALTLASCLGHPPEIP